MDSITIELTIEALNVDRISFFDSIFIRSSRVGQLRKKRANTRFGVVTSSRKERSSRKNVIIAATVTIIRVVKMLKSVVLAQ